MTGRIAGIARHGRKFGPVETLPAVSVSLIDGVDGDHASRVSTHKPSRKRQVSLIEQDCWNAALAEIGVTRPFEVRDLTFLRPLASPDGGHVDVQVVLTPTEEGYHLDLRERVVVGDTTAEDAPTEMTEEASPEESVVAEETPVEGTEPEAPAAEDDAKA